MTETTETVNRTIESRLREEVAFLRQHNAPAGAWFMQQALIDAGKDYPGEPLPKRYKRRTPRMCFRNAITLARKSEAGLQYCEGYVMNQNGSGLLIHHGWAVTPDGKVIDPTLAAPEEYVYRGVCFRQSEYTVEIGPYYPHTASLFDTGSGINYHLLSRLSPTVKAAFTEMRNKGA